MSSLALEPRIQTGSEPRQPVHSILLTQEQREQLIALEQRQAELLAISGHNPIYADLVQARIYAQEQMLVPFVQAAEKAAHEQFGMHDLTVQLLAKRCGPELFKAFEECATNYMDWQVARLMPLCADEQAASDDCAAWGSILHPSRTITAALRDELISRGFTWEQLGWVSPEGAVVVVTDWLVPHAPADGSTFDAVGDWTDRADLLPMHRHYDAQYEAMLVAAMPTRARYLDVYEEADAARRMGQDKASSPHQAGTLEQLAWDRAFFGEVVPWNRGRESRQA